MPTCYKGDDLPKGFLFFEVNDVNPLNALTFELETAACCGMWSVSFRATSTIMRTATLRS